MTEQEVFVLADRTLNDVVAMIADDQWDMRMPASLLAAARVSHRLSLLGLTGRDPYGA